MTHRTRDSRERAARPRGVRKTLRSEQPKNAGALVCRGCGVYQHRGTWHLGPPPIGKLRAGSCPACERVRTGVQAGTLELPERFLEPGEEALDLIRNCAEIERAEHPLERLMEIEKSGKGLRVTTTGLHLARRIAHRLAKRFHAKARFHYSQRKDEVRVEWSD